jgi:hypothetical protein
MNKPTIPLEEFVSLIYTIRGQRVMLDSDLAALYEVTTSRLNEQAKRNQGRFPPEFMFQLTKEEFDNLKSQNATSSWGGRRHLPFAFTEHGAIMAARVLNSEAAIKASIYVVKAFMELRNIAAMYKELDKRITELEGQFEKHDEKISGILQVIRQFLQVGKPRKAIGFKRKGEE